MGLRTWLGLKRPAARRLPRTWTELAHLRRLHKLRDVPVLSKMGMAEVARACGVRTPALLREFNDAEHIDLVGLPASIVLKPTVLAARRGVMLLTRTSDDLFFEGLRGNTINAEEIRNEEIEWQKLWRERRKGSFKLIIEEMIVGENGTGQIPFDYKLYTFDGRVRFVIQTDRNVKPYRLAFFLNEFEQFDLASRLITPWKRNAPGVPIIPKCYRKLVDAAKRISTYMKAPFLSVDTYAGIDGPVIGEITTTPGDPYYGTFSFLPAFDEELGGAWIDGLRRHNIEIPWITGAPIRKRKSNPLPRERL